MYRYGTLASYNGKLWNANAGHLPSAARIESKTLNDVMAFDHVIQVHDNGAISDVDDIYEPEIKIGSDKDGQVLAEHDAQMIEDMRLQGWSVLSGYTNQHGYNGPILHSSEFIGGGLARDILETPGLYVALVLKDYDNELVGWIVAHREV